MTEKDEELLADPLLRWEELYEQGQDVPAAELCADCPPLAEELARRIHALKVTAWLDKAGDDDLNSDAPPSGANDVDDGQTRTLVGRYRLDKLIAEGGFARVWLAYDLELQRVVAVKVPKPTVAIAIAWDTISPRSSRSSFSTDIVPISLAFRQALLPRSNYEAAAEGDHISLFLTCRPSSSIGAGVSSISTSAPSVSVVSRWPMKISSEPVIGVHSSRPR